MKKMLFILMTMITMVTTATVLANSHESQCAAHKRVKIDTTIICEGKHCGGTVGCSCPGFSPITNGKVWQQEYCRHCGHHKRCHK